MSTLEVARPGNLLCCMNEDGDKRIMWDSSNDGEITEARRVFDEYKAKGYLAYRTNSRGEKGTVIDKFDAKAERIIMQPQMVGG